MTDKDDQINFTKEAFLHPLNLGVLFICTLTAFFLNDMGLVSNIILSTVFGLELVYLGIIPGMPRFRQNVKARKQKERSSGDEDKILFEQLDRKSQKKFLVLKYLTKNVEENFDKLPYTSQGLLDNIKKKMSDLLTNYLTLLDLHRRYQMYINTEVEEGLKREAEIEKRKIDKQMSEPDASQFFSNFITCARFDCQPLHHFGCKYNGYIRIIPPVPHKQSQNF